MAAGGEGVAKSVSISRISETHPWNQSQHLLWASGTSWVNPWVSFWTIGWSCVQGHVEWIVLHSGQVSAKILNAGNKHSIHCTHGRGKCYRTWEAKLQLISTTLTLYSMWIHQWDALAGHLAFMKHCQVWDSYFSCFICKHVKNIETVPDKGNTEETKGKDVCLYQHKKT